MGAAPLTAPSPAAAQQRSAVGPASPLGASSPFPVAAVAADGYLVRLAALESAPAFTLAAVPSLESAGPTAANCAAAVAASGATRSLRAAAAGQAEELRALVCATLPSAPAPAQPAEDGRPRAATTDDSAASALVNPYALVPSLFGPCLPYAVAPLLFGPLWQDILVAGPVLKYSTRRCVRQWEGKMTAGVRRSQPPPLCLLQGSVAPRLCGPARARRRQGHCAARAGSGRARRSWCRAPAALPCGARDTAHLQGPHRSRPDLPSRGHPRGGARGAGAAAVGADRSVTRALADGENC